MTKCYKKPALYYEKRAKSQNKYNIITKLLQPLTPFKKFDKMGTN